MQTREQIQKIFLMFQTIYLRKWTDNFSTKEIFEIAIVQWQKGLQGIDMCYIEKAIDYCRVCLEWPPSIAEFITLCERELGVPTSDEVYTQALSRDFKSLLVKQVFDDVGSWSFKNDTEKMLKEKVKISYKKCLEKNRLLNNLLGVIK